MSHDGSGNGLHEQRATIVAELRQRPHEHHGQRAVEQRQSSEQARPIRIARVPGQSKRRVPGDEAPEEPPEITVPDIGSGIGASKSFP